MQVPDFLLRKLYRKGSLREVGNAHFEFGLRNVLGTATIVEPPVVVVNGIGYKPQDVDIGEPELATITATSPWVFRKGDEVTVQLPGYLLRAGNRIHILARTVEFGDVEIYAEDRARPVRTSDSEE